MGFLSGLAKFNNAVTNFFMPIPKAIDSFKKGKIGQGLAEIFVPGVASVTGAKSVDDETSDFYVSSSDSEIIEEVGKTDLNDDGITLADDIEIAKNVVGDYIEDNYGVNIPWLDTLDDKVENNDSKKVGGAWVLAPLFALGLLFI